MGDKAAYWHMVVWLLRGKGRSAYPKVPVPDGFVVVVRWRIGLVSRHTHLGARVRLVACIRAISLSGKVWPLDVVHAHMIGVEDVA